MFSVGWGGGVGLVERLDACRVQHSNFLLL